MPLYRHHFRPGGGYKDVRFQVYSTEPLTVEAGEDLGPSADIQNLGSARSLRILGGLKDYMPFVWILMAGAILCYSRQSTRCLDNNNRNHWSGSCCGLSWDYPPKPYRGGVLSHLLPPLGSFHKNRGTPIQTPKRTSLTLNRKAQTLNPKA